MGGINHQPCNRVGTSYLKFSTRMSCALSNARAEFEGANVSLENILLGELGAADQPGSTEEMRHKLSSSRSFLAELKANIASLRADMREHDYRDLSEILGVRADAVASELLSGGFGTKPAWDWVGAIMQSKGFYGMLDDFDAQIAVLDELGAKLSSKVYDLTSEEAEGRVTEILERNLPGNLKVEFAQLYSAWNRFQEIFLASSLLSTELWYRFNRTGSLLQEPVHVRAVA